MASFSSSLQNNKQWFCSPCDSEKSVFNLKNWCAQKRHYFIRVAGPCQSGKTSVLRYLRDGGNKNSPAVSVVEDVLPTSGMEADIIDFGERQVFVTDSRTQSEADYLAEVLNKHLDEVDWESKPCDALVFVYDVSDQGRYSLANRSLSTLLSHFNTVGIVMLLATKIDLASSTIEKMEPTRSSSVERGSTKPLPVQFLNTLQTLGHQALERFSSAVGAASMQGGNGGGGPMKETQLSSSDNPIIDHHKTIDDDSEFKDVFESNVLPMPSQLGGATSSAKTRSRSVTTSAAAIDKADLPIYNKGLANRQTRYFYTSAKTGEGIHRAFSWLLNTIDVAYMPTSTTIIK